MRKAAEHIKAFAEAQKATMRELSVLRQFRGFISDIGSFRSIRVVVMSQAGVIRSIRPPIC